MTVVLAPAELRRVKLWRGAIVVAFAVTGLALASWVTRTPAIRDALGASTGMMGLVIAGLSVGSFIGIACGGALVAGRGARFVVGMGMLAMATGQIVIGVGAATGQGWAVALGLAFFGFGMGGGEIGQNVEGVAIEQLWGRIVVPGLHGSFSVGVCVGALLGIWLNTLHVPVLLHLAGAAAVILAGTFWLLRQLPAATGREETRKEKVGWTTTVKEGFSVWKEPRTVLLGVIILGMALAEGSANDWLPLIVVDGFAMTAATGALIYALFAASMAVGRFAGGPLITRIGRVAAIRACAVAGVLGIGVVILAPGNWVFLGVVLWGLGASLGFPTVLSAAGDDPINSARRVSAVAAAGYLAFLVGPPLLGLLGEFTGLRWALAPVAVLVVVAGLMAKALRPPRTQGE